MKEFDACEHRIRQLVIKAGEQRRKELGMPEELNITKIYNEMAPLLGISPILMSSKDVNHLPAPSEMKDAKGNFVVPNKPCPKCGKIMFLESICQSCEDAEGGKYKSGYSCNKRFGGCGFMDEKNGEWLSQRLNRMGIDFGSGTKESLGIRTHTDQDK